MDGLSACLPSVYSKSTCSRNCWEKSVTMDDTREAVRFLKSGQYHHSPDYREPRDDVQARGDVAKEAKGEEKWDISHDRYRVRIPHLPSF